jgi:archaeal flagellin FlaB
VVVAAVFSYVVLGAGFFTTQKSQAVVHTGIQQASSSMEILGSVYGHSTTHASGLDWIRFTVGTTSGGASIDLQKLTVTLLRDGGSMELLTDQTASATYAQVIGGTYVCGSGTLAANAQSWGITGLNNDNGGANLVLEPGEQAILCVVPSAALGLNSGFTIYLQPVVGASFPIHRVVPAAVTDMNTIY